MRDEGVVITARTKAPVSVAPKRRAESPIITHQAQIITNDGSRNAKRNWRAVSRG